MSHSPPALECRILTEESELAAITGEWRQLQSKHGVNLITDCDLFQIWWDTIGRHEPRQLHLVTGWRDGKLSAILPLTVMRRCGIRVLQSDNSILPECDTLCEEPEDATHLWQTARQSPYYDFAKIKAVYPQTACCEALFALARKRDVLETFYLRFDRPSGEAWLTSLPNKVRSDFKRNMRRLEEKGPVQYHVCREAPLPAPIVNGMIRQKSAWADAHGKTGLMRNEHAADYFRKMLQNAAERGNLYLSWLTCGEETIAYELRLGYQGVLHGYLLTYDAAWAKYSPGSVIMANSILWSADHGQKGIDFKYTTESESQKFFKRKFCNENRHCYEFTFSNTPYGRLLETSFIALREAARKMATLKRSPPQKSEGKAA